MSNSDVLTLQDYLGNVIVANFYKAYAKEHSLEPEEYMPSTLRDIGRVLKMIQRANEIENAGENRLIVNVRIGGGGFTDEDRDGRLYPFRDCDVESTLEQNIGYCFGELKSQSEVYSRTKHGKANEIYIWDRKTSHNAVVNILPADEHSNSLVARNYNLFVGLRAYYDQIGYLSDIFTAYDGLIALAFSEGGGSDEEMDEKTDSV